MRAHDPNLPHLRLIAEALGELRNQVVFVGGSVAGLLVTDPLADAVRATRDIDAVVNTSRAAFHRMEAEVASKGFKRDLGSEVICRWVHEPSGVLFDLMPVQPEVLGFSNRWYPLAVETATAVDLGGGVVVRLVNAVAFVATKLEAFIARGRGDFFSSHDLEDILNIVDGRPELAAELQSAPSDVREVIADRFSQLLADTEFANALPGLIAEPDRYDVIRQRLTEMSQAKLVSPEPAR